MSSGPSGSVPSASVLAAFGVAGTPVPLAGGQGRSVRVGGFVFKPTDEHEHEHEQEDAVEWATSVFEQLASNGGFRVPKPLRAVDGRGAVEGWSAHEFLAGEPGPQGRWSDVLDAGRAFHAAVRHVPRPAFLARRTHPWAVGDRAAWEEREADVIDDLEAPAVIDFSPYWRPPAFADAVVVVDGLLWFDPPPHLVTSVGDVSDWQQLLIRALIFRLVAQSGLAGTPGRSSAGERERYLRAIEAVVNGRAPH
ncbi:aminoglycoside phosphotransferase [Streptomyces formicae]